MKISDLRKLVLHSGACDSAQSYLYSFDGEMDVKAAFDGLHYSNKPWLLHLIYDAMSIMGVSHDDIIQTDRGFYRLTDSALDGFARGITALYYQLRDDNTNVAPETFYAERDRRWQSFKSQFWELHGSQILYILESAVELI